jgi:hypothetical protein
MMESDSTHTWRSHGINDLLVIHHQQVPLLPARSIMHRAAASGIGVPQIWSTFISTAIVIAIDATKSKTRSQGCPGGYWCPGITTNCTEIIRVEDACDDAVHMLCDHMRGWEELSLEFLGEFGVGFLPELFEYFGESESFYQRMSGLGLGGHSQQLRIWG